MQQNDRHRIQIILQEVIDIINNVTTEEMMRDNEIQKETIKDYKI